MAPGKTGKELGKEPGKERSPTTQLTLSFLVFPARINQDFT
jgi:hypothetical protein